MENIAGHRRTDVAAPNHSTIGCELENAGRLRRIGGQVYCWPYFVNPDAPEPERRPDPRCALELALAMVTSDGLFDTFTPAQEASATALLRALAARYGWTREVSAYGHVEFDPTRREDPGPIWRHSILPRVLDAVFVATSTGRTNAAAAEAG